MQQLIMSILLTTAESWRCVDVRVFSGQYVDIRRGLLAEIGCAIMDGEMVTNAGTDGHNSRLPDCELVRILAETIHRLGYAPHTPRRRRPRGASRRAQEARRRIGQGGA